MSYVGQGEDEVSRELEERVKIKGREKKIIYIYISIFDKVIFMYLYKNIIVCMYINIMK